MSFSILEYESRRDPEASSASPQGSAFLMLRACHLLFCNLPLASISGKFCQLLLWQSYFKVSIEIFFSFLFSCCGFCAAHDAASANPDTVVMVCFLEKNELPENYPLFSPASLIH